MEVWLLEWDYPYDVEHNTTVWADEQSALKQACAEIKKKIDSDWDMDDSDMEDHAQQFDGFMASGKYRDAMLVWNSYQDNFNDDEGQWYFVRELPVLGHTDIDAGCSPPTQRSGTVAFKATTAGATCRGPCKQWNEYAYADQPDGTHMCRQCSTFGHIFGTNKP